MTNLGDTASGFDHLDLSDVVCPSLIFEQFRNLATEMECLAQERVVDGQTGLKFIESSTTRIRVLRKFELFHRREGR